MYAQYFALVLLLCTCGPAQETEVMSQTAKEVIDRAVVAHGMERLDSVDIAFTFRDKSYKISTRSGQFTYVREFVDSTEKRIRDVLTNAGLTRQTDGASTELSPKDSAAYANSVNSVRYFFMLPYGLNDPAVNTELLSVDIIAGEAFHRVSVTFDEQGGGTDFDDVYHYFFNRETGQMDYLAYTFEVDGGGIRFREAINKRRVNGVLVQDYRNYGLDGNDRNIGEVGQRFENDDLPLLSVIANTGVRIEGLPE